MQTFLPYPDFDLSLACLDYRRLGKQRVESLQIIKANSAYRTKLKPYGWQNHPAVKMWRGYDNALMLYHNKAIEHWVERGYKNTMGLFTIEGPIVMPPWFGDEQFHLSHQSNLMRKAPEHYVQFHWTAPLNMPYVWPTN